MFAPVPDRKKLKQLETRIRKRLQALGSDYDAWVSAATHTLMIDRAPPEAPPDAFMLKMEITRARRGKRDARRVLGLWWRHQLLHPPQALAEYVAEAFDRRDLNVALGLSRGPGQRGRDDQEEERLRGARAAIVRYFLLEHSGAEKLAYRKGCETLGYAIPGTLKRSCGHRVAELMADQPQYSHNLEHVVACRALDAVRELLGVARDNK